MRILHYACIAAVGMLVNCEYANGLQKNALEALDKLNCENKNKVEVAQVKEWFDVEIEKTKKCHDKFLVVEVSEESETNSRKNVLQISIFKKDKNGSFQKHSFEAYDGDSYIFPLDYNDVINNSLQKQFKVDDLSYDQIAMSWKGENELLNNTLKIVKFKKHLYVVEADTSIPVIFKGFNIGFIGNNKFTSIAAFATNVFANYGNINAASHVSFGSFHQIHTGAVNGDKFKGMDINQFNQFISDEEILRDLQAKYTSEEPRLWNLGGEINAKEVKVEKFNIYDFDGNINIQSLQGDKTNSFYTNSRNVEGEVHKYMFEHFHIDKKSDINIENIQDITVYECDEGNDFQQINLNDSKGFNKSSNLTDVSYKGEVVKIYGSIFAPLRNKQWKIEKDANEWQLLADNSTKFHIEPFDLDNNRDKYVCPWWKLSSDDSKVVFYVSNNDHKIFVKTNKNEEEQLLPQRFIGNLQNVIPLSGPKVEEDMKKIFDVLPAEGESQQIPVDDVRMDECQKININGRKYSIRNGSSYRFVRVDQNKPEANIAMSMDGLRPLIVDRYNNPVYDKNGKLVYSRTHCNGVCVGVNAVTGGMCGVSYELVYDDQGNLIEEYSKESSDAVSVKYRQVSAGIPPSDSGDSWN